MKALFVTVTLSALVLLIAMMASEQHNGAMFVLANSTTGANDTTTVVTESTIAPSTTAGDVTTLAPAAGSTVAPTTSLVPPPTPSTLAPGTSAPSTTAAPATTTAAPAPVPTTTTAAATVKLIVQMLKANNTAAGREAFRFALAQALGIPVSALSVAEGKTADEYIVSITGTSNMTADQIAAKAEALPRSELAALGAGSIEVDKRDAAGSPELNIPLIAGVAGAGLVLVVLATYCIIKKKSDSEGTGSTYQGSEVNGGATFSQMEKELRTARGAQGEL